MFKNKNKEDRFYLLFRETSNTGNVNVTIQIGWCLPSAIAILIVFSKRPDLYEYIKITTLLIEQNQSLNI